MFLALCDSYSRGAGRVGRGQGGKTCRFWPVRYGQRRRRSHRDHWPIGNDPVAEPERPREWTQRETGVSQWPDFRFTARPRRGFDCRQEHHRSSFGRQTSSGARTGQLSEYGSDFFRTASNTVYLPNGSCRPWRGARCELYSPDGSDVCVQIHRTIGAGRGCSGTGRSARRVAGRFQAL